MITTRKFPSYYNGLHQMMTSRAQPLDVHRQSKTLKVARVNFSALFKVKAIKDGKSYVEMGMGDFRRFLVRQMVVPPGICYM